MNKRVREQINKFLDKSHFISSATRNTQEGNTSKLRLSRRQTLKELSTRGSASRLISHTSSFHTSKDSSLNNSYLHSLGNTLSKSLINPRSRLSKSRDEIISRLNTKKLTPKQRSAGGGLLRELYKAKIEDFGIESNKNTQKAFQIRMQLGLSTRKLNCKGLGMGKNSLAVIRRHLVFGGNIRSLILDNNCFSLECFILISRVIQESTIVQLSLASTNMNSESCRIILDSLQGNDHLCNLNLSSSDGLYRNKLGADGLKPFKTLFNQVPTIHSISLDGSSISEDGFRSICEGLLNNTSLYGLQVARNLISQSLFRRWGDRLSNCSLVVLDLTGNGIKDKGMALLGDLLGSQYAYNTLSVRLKSLNIAQNGITVTGVEQFSKSMKVNSTLESLTLDNNRMSNRGHAFQTFKAFIHQNISISFLSLRNCNIQSLDMLLFFEGLQRNNSLLTLNLSENILDDYSLRALGSVFKNNECLKTVYLRSCSIVDSTFSSLSEGIKSNCCLQRLYLDRNFLKNQSADLIQRFLVLRRNITVVSCEKNLISIQHLKEISRILADNVFIASGKLEFPFFQKRRATNRGRIAKLKHEVGELERKLEGEREKRAEEELVAVLVQIDEVRGEMEAERARLLDLQKLHTFLTQ